MFNSYKWHFSFISEEFENKTDEEVELKTTDEKILNELQQIREHLIPKEEPKEPEVKKKRIKKFAVDFVEFIRKYRVLGLAVAFIMATYVGLLVSALVNDLIMPIFQYIPGLNQLDKLSDWQVGYFFIGDFLATTITFIIISLVIFLIVKAGTKLGLEAE